VRAVARLLLAVCAAMVTHVPAAGADPTAVEPGKPPSQPAPGASAPAAADKSVKKVLVDDTVTDAQLKQILARGYKPESQARGNEVYYCRREHELGSRFETKVCKTSRRILQDELQGKEATTRVQRTDGSRTGQ